MKKWSSAARLTLFSTLLLTAAIFILFVFLLADIQKDMAAQGLTYQYRFASLGVFLLFLALAGLIAYVTSALVIDRALNPVRLMITQIKQIGNMNFSKPLAIHSEDEEIKEYVAAFNDMAQKLHRYIEQQKRFISDASHELATPITVINGHADLLLRRAKSQPELLENGLEIIKTEALRMDGLVDSLLLLARGDSGKQMYNIEPHLISELITEAVSEAEWVSPGFTFETDIRQDFTVKCDGPAMRRVLRILLSNAVKYSGDGRLVWVSAYTSHGLAYISVKDQGIGIDAQYLPRIFDRFYRVDASRSLKTGGSGLGLAIAKEIIQAHGGKITVSSRKSRPGGGDAGEKEIPAMAGTEFVIII